MKILKSLGVLWKSWENATMTTQTSTLNEGNRTAAIASHKFLVKCSLLDPRFKDDISPDDVTSAKTQLIEEFNEKNTQGKYN